MASRWMASTAVYRGWYHGRKHLTIRGARHQMCQSRLHLAEALSVTGHGMQPFHAPLGTAKEGGFPSASAFLINRD